MALTGFSEYMESHQLGSVFADFAASGETVALHLCSAIELIGIITVNDVYELTFCLASGEDEVPQEQKISKHDVLFVCRPQDLPSVQKQLKGAASAVEPLKNPSKRNYIKNKTLFPLMKERQVVLVTLIDGVTMRGLIAGFNRFEIQLHLKGGIPVTILRHGVLTMQSKSGRSLLKRDQDVLQDWKKSPLYKN